MTAGFVATAAKALDLLASAGVKNEERLAKRDDRLQRRDKKRRARHVLENEVIDVDLLADVEEQQVDQYRKIQGAFAVLVPIDAAAQVEEALPEWLSSYQVAVPLSDLAEYGVKIRLPDQQPLPSQ